MQKIGIIGGGQLARMMAIPAQLLGFSVSIFAQTPTSPAVSFANHITVADLNDEKSLTEFANTVDILTIETENISYSILEKFHNKILPCAKSIQISQNRIKEKNFVADLGINTATFAEITNNNDIMEFFRLHGPCFVKTAHGGYDGYGQVFISHEEQIENINIGTQSIIEKKVDFVSESSVILTRNKSGECFVFPIPNNIHRNGILIESTIPSLIDNKISIGAINATIKIANALNYVGTMAVEYFITKDGFIFNEMAPRPHNSGHYTIDLCNVSQFENHIRAISGLPCIQPKLVHKGSMYNILGEDGTDMSKLLAKENIRLHMYGKTEKPGRKMGHYVIINNI